MIAGLQPVSIAMSDIDVRLSGDGILISLAGRDGIEPCAVALTGKVVDEAFAARLRNALKTLINGRAIDEDNAT